MSMKGSNVRQPSAEDYKKSGMTKQAFRDSTDINKILAKAQKTGTVSHINTHGAHYGDFEAFDFHQAQIMLARGREIFDELPSEIRSEFDQDPGKFFKFVNQPDNKEKLEELLPALAAPGRQFPDIGNARIAVTTVGEALAAAEAAAGGTPAPAPTGDETPAETPTGDEGGESEQ